MGSKKAEQRVALVMAPAIAVFVAIQVFWLKTASTSDYLLYVFLAAMLWWAWPQRKGRHTDHASIQAESADDDVIVYWRPG